MTYLIVFLGGGLGAALRHGINILSVRWLGTAFPYGTLFINVTGSLIMGLIAGYFAFKGGISQHWTLFLTTGVLGGYTTFSAFSLDVALLYERGDTARGDRNHAFPQSRKACCLGPVGRSAPADSNPKLRLLQDLDHMR